MGWYYIFNMEIRIMNEEDDLQEAPITPIQYYGVQVPLTMASGNNQRSGNHYQFQDLTDFHFQNDLQYDFQGAD